jgi:hypothetical protein
MTTDVLIRIHECHERSTELIAQSYLQLNKTEELIAASKSRSLAQAIQETRAMRADAQKLMADTRRLVSVARAALFTAGQD